MVRPDTWNKTALRSVVADIQAGFAQSPRFGASIGQIRTHNITPEGDISLEGIKSVSPSDKEIQRYSLLPGDIIFNNTNSEEWVGKTALYRLDQGHVFSNHITRLRVDETVAKPEFVARYLHYLWSTGFSRTRAKRWVSQAAIEQSALLEFPLNLPPLEEQGQIVAILQKANGLRRMRQTGLEKSREISITLFREMFGDPGSNESGWECAALKDLATIVTGNTPPRKITKYYGDFIEWIKSDNIAPPYIFLTTATERLSETGAKMGRVVPQDSTLITCIAGSPNSIGNAAMANRPVALNQQINAVIPNERLRPLFLYWQLRMAKPLIQRMSTGNMKGMVTKGKLGELILMVPPLPLQEKFVTVSTSALQLQIRLEASLEALKQTLEQLSIDAFAGRLTRSRHQAQGMVSSSATLTHMLRRVGASLGNDLAAQRENDAALDHKPGISARHRKWLLDQLSEVQSDARDALLREWSGTLVPTEHMEDFMRSWPIEDREGQEDRIKRALSELAGLGLIARLSIPNESGDYVTAYRGLREDELSRVDDLDAIKRALGDD